MSHKEIYSYSKLKPQYDYTATGFYIFNQKNIQTCLEKFLLNMKI